MKKLVLSALGAALALGGASVASAESSPKLAQFLLPGQPGWTGPVNRTVPPGMPTSGNIPGGTFQTAPTGFTSQPAPQLSRPEFIDPADRTPGEVDAEGRITPTNELRKARFIGERDAEGKILPTYQPQRAQAPQSQTGREPTVREQTRDAQRGQSTSGTMGPQDRAVERPMRRGGQMQSQQRSRQMDRQGAGDITRPGMASPPNATAMLNSMSAQGYRPTSSFSRSGDSWMGTAMKDGREVTVMYDPRTQQITER